MTKEERDALERAGYDTGRTVRTADLPGYAEARERSKRRPAPDLGAAELARAGYGEPPNPTKDERVALAASDATTNAMLRADHEAHEAALRRRDHVPAPEPLSATSQRLLGLS